MLQEHFATSFRHQFAVLFRRAWVNAMRHPVSTRAAGGRSIVMGLLVGMLFSRTALDQAGVQDRSGALYFVLTTQIFSAQGSMRVFVEERDLFLRERIAGAYRTSAYFWSKSLADTPLQIAFALVFSLIGYSLVGLQWSAGHVATYALVVVIITVAAESYVVMIGALVSTDKVAAVLGPVAFALMSLFGGFFINIDSLPFFLSWLQYGSLFRFGYAALMQNEFAGLRFHCSESDGTAWLDRLDDATRAHVEEFKHLLPCPTPDGETHLRRLKLDGLGLWANVAVLAGYAVLFRLLAFRFLVARANRTLALAHGPSRPRPKAE